MTTTCVFPRPAARCVLLLAVSMGLAGCHGDRADPHEAAHPAAEAHQEHPAADAQQDHGQHDMPALRLDDGRKWATDAALREGMERMRAVSRQHDQDAAVLAQSVRDEVSWLTRNCRLPADADAVLHVLIARMLQAAAAIENGDEHGQHQLQAVIDEYPHYFDHQGWIP